MHLQRLYASTIQGRAAFFEYLKEAVEDFNRRMILVKVSVCGIPGAELLKPLQTDDRFSVGIFMKGMLSWNDEVSIHRLRR